jgi:arginine deiminase
LNKYDIREFKIVCKETSCIQGVIDDTLYVPIFCMTDTQTQRQQAVQNLNVSSESGLLKTVIIHRPGAEIDRLLPDNYRTYLFEDIPFLGKIQREHNVFAAIIASKGATILYIEDLIETMLQNDTGKQQTVEAVAALERCEGIVDDLLREDAATLTTIFIAGLRASEARAHGYKVSQYIPDDRMLMPPIPNLYFMRDPAAIIGDAIISSNMFYQARSRESLIVEQVFRYHPNFLKNDNFVYGTKEDERYQTIEGGDIIVLNR